MRFDFIFFEVRKCVEYKCGDGCIVMYVFVGNFVLVFICILNGEKIVDCL